MSGLFVNAILKVTKQGGITIATTVYTVQEITLQDGREVLLRPASIKGLRKFMKKMDEFQKATEEDEIVDILLDAAAILLMKDHPDLWDKKKDRGFLPAEPGEDPEPKEKGGFSEVAEEVLDMPTIYRVIDVCGGIKLDDPKLVEAAMESVTARTPGTT